MPEKKKKTEKAEEKTSRKAPAKKTVKSAEEKPEKSAVKKTAPKAAKKTAKKTAADTAGKKAVKKTAAKEAAEKEPAAKEAAKKTAKKTVKTEDAAAKKKTVKKAAKKAAETEKEAPKKTTAKKAAAKKTVKKAEKKTEETAAKKVDKKTDEMTPEKKAAIKKSVEESKKLIALVQSRKAAAAKADKKEDREDKKEAKQDKKGAGDPYSNFETMRDEDLVDLAVKKGSGAAQEYLLHKYRNFVKGKSRTYYLVGGEKEDVIQEGMIGLYKAIRDFDRTKNSSFRSFAEVCVTRQIITAIKTATRQKHIPLNNYVSFDRPIYEQDSDRTLLDIFPSEKTDALNPENMYVRREELRDLRRRMGEILSDFEWSVFQCHSEGKSYQEIAAILGKHVKSIDNALQRVKRKLDRYLTERSAAEKRALEKGRKDTGDTDPSGKKAALKGKKAD